MSEELKPGEYSVMVTNTPGISRMRWRCPDCAIITWGIAGQAYINWAWRLRGVNYDGTEWDFLGFLRNHHYQQTECHAPHRKEKADE